VELMGWQCPSCGHQTLYGTEMTEFGRLLADEYRAEHGLLTSREIVAIRNRLGMSQDLFAKFLGNAGVASVKRWELGKIQDRIHNDLILEKTKYHALGKAAAGNNAATYFLSYSLPSNYGTAASLLAFAKTTLVDGLVSYVSCKMEVQKSTQELLMYRSALEPTANSTSRSARIH
jgi:putative zinc finger/helix-turn-helix YgiT family protein